MKNVASCSNLALQDSKWQRNDQLKYQINFPSSKTLPNQSIQTKKKYMKHKYENIYFRFPAFGWSLAGWKTLEAAMRFSMYCPNTWFSDRNLKFSSFTLSTLDDKSSKVFCSSRTWAISLAFSSCSSGLEFR
jgi:hypothetical protein